MHICKIYYSSVIHHVESLFRCFLGGALVTKKGTIQLRFHHFAVAWQIFIKYVSRLNYENAESESAFAHKESSPFLCYVLKNLIEFDLCLISQKLGV